MSIRNQALESPNDEKIEAYIDHRDHVEDHVSKADVIGDAHSKGQLATGFEDVSIPRTIVTFKMACLVCFMATFAAATDGYQSESPF
jgi:hypothetical protein